MLRHHFPFQTQHLSTRNILKDSAHNSPPHPIHVVTLRVLVVIMRGPVPVLVQLALAPGQGEHIGDSAGDIVCLHLMKRNMPVVLSMLSPELHPHSSVSKLQSGNLTPGWAAMVSWSTLQPIRGEHSADQSQLTSPPRAGWRTCPRRRTRGSRPRRRSRCSPPPPAPRSARCSAP